MWRTGEYFCYFYTFSLCTELCLFLEIWVVPFSCSISLVEVGNSELLRLSSFASFSTWIVKLWRLKYFQPYPGVFLPLGWVSWSLWNRELIHWSVIHFSIQFDYRIVLKLIVEFCQLEAVASCSFGLKRKGVFCLMAASAFLLHGIVKNILSKIPELPTAVGERTGACTDSLICTLQAAITFACKKGDTVMR